jgi:hypothetical protein
MHRNPVRGLYVATPAIQAETHAVELQRQLDERSHQALLLQQRVAELELQARASLNWGYIVWILPCLLLLLLVPLLPRCAADGGLCCRRVFGRRHTVLAMLACQKLFSSPDAWVKHLVWLQSQSAACCHG